jgi:hypothetical protein
MDNEPRDMPDDERDSSEVVTGGSGKAHLVEPEKAKALGAELEDLPGVEPGELEEAVPPEERRA